MFLKGGVDGFSYISLISVILFSNQDNHCIQVKNQVIWLLSLCNPKF